jgi:anti-sigma factor ChrR (cupin superfamily)
MPGELYAMDKQIKVEQSNVSFIDGESTSWRTSTVAPGVEVKDLGKANGRAMQLVRFPPGTVFPVHKHEGPEFVYILEGEMLQNGKRLGRGWASVSSAGTVDEDVRSDTGCVFLLVYSE